MDLNGAGMVIRPSRHADYHKALRIPLRRGRLSMPSTGRNPQVVILSQSHGANTSPEDPLSRTASRSTIASSSASRDVTSWA